MSFSALLAFLKPDLFSPLVVVATVVGGGLYWRGLRRARAKGMRTGVARPLSFFVGLGLVYGVQHTQFDYFAQFVFFMHRIQHLVLHHLGPFLICLAAPGPVLALGLPEPLRRRWLAPIGQWPPLRLANRVVQHPVVAPILFVGLIFFWLTPSIHFDAMLNLRLYHLMNWSMFLDGLLFWWLILDPRNPDREITLGYPLRVLLLFLIMPPQIVLGAYIALSGNELYDVYAVCGRAWPLSPATDQLIGGLLTWGPAAMMSVAGILAVLHQARRTRADPRPGQRPTRSPVPAGQ